MLATITYPADKYFVFTYPENSDYVNGSWTIQICEECHSNVCKEWCGVPKENYETILNEAVDITYLMNCEAGETHQFFIEELL